MSFYRIQSNRRPVESILEADNQFSINYCDAADVRAGKSVCGSVEELAEYLAQTGIPFDDTYLLVELDGYASDDNDADAHMGAVLVHPTRIISAETLTDEFFDMIGEAYDALAAA